MTSKCYTSVAKGLKPKVSKFLGLTPTFVEVQGKSWWWGEGFLVPILNRVKGFASIYNFESLNESKPELQLKDTKSATKTKLKGSLTHLKGYKFVATLVTVFQR